jgi:hypothetical protein
MHCDRVFTILTRGPFPAGEVTDVAVELHLAHCSACRRLAEALRPSESPMRETIEPAAAIALPGYRGDHPAWTATAVRSPESIAPPAVLPIALPLRSGHRRRRVRLRVARMLGLVLLGIAVGAAWTTLAGLSTNNAPSRNFALASLSGVNRADGDRERQSLLLERLELPPVCRKFDHERFLPLSADAGDRFYLGAKSFALECQCCTQCHAAGEKLHLATTARTRLVQSCTICHAGDSGPSS